MKLNKCILTATISMLLAVSLAACSGSTPATVSSSSQPEVLPSTDSASSPESSQANQAIAFTDDAGNTIELAKPLEKVVVFNKMNTEIIRALGKIDTVIGVDENTAQDKAYWKELDLNATMGKNQSTLDYEKIAAAAPDAIIIPRNGSYEEAIQQLTPFGIKVIVATGWENVKFENQVKILATAFGVEEKGQEYIDFCKKPLEQIQEKLANIPEDQRKTVYFENSGEYKTCLVGSGWNDMIVSGGGKNLFGDLVFSDSDSAKGSVHSFDVDPEEILHRNPDMILLNVYSTQANSGTSIYVDLGENEIPNELATMVTRSGWDNLDAVKNKQVYGFSAFTGNACFKIVASGYLAKWLYPDVFTDLDPDAFYQEWLAKYQNVEPLEIGQTGQLKG